MTCRCCHPDPDGIVSGTASQAANDAREGLERVRRLEAALAGDPAALAAIREDFAAKVAREARPRLPAPTFADALKRLYSVESVELESDCPITFAGAVTA